MRTAYYNYILQSLPHLPMECICGALFTVDHAFTCPHGGYPTLRHNEIRDITAQLMSEVCPNVAMSQFFNQLLMNVSFIALQTLRLVLTLM